MISPHCLHFTHNPLGISCFFVLVSEIFGFSFSSNTAMRLDSLYNDGKSSIPACHRASRKSGRQISRDSTFLRARDMGMLVAARLRSETNIQEMTSPHG